MSSLALAGTRRLNISGTYVGLILAIVATSVALSIASPFFLTWVNFVNISNQIAVNLIIAVGMTIIITTEGIDLSVGSNVAVTGVVVGLLFRVMAGGPWALLVGIIVGVGTGVVIGLLNGTMINAIGVPPFIATLGMMVALRGVALILSQGRVLFDIPPLFETTFSGFIFGFPRPILIAFMAVILGHIILHHTPIGRYGMAVGGNERCAAVTGLAVKKIKYAVYAMGGGLAALSGLTLTGMMSAAEPIAGVFYELDAVAVVVMGGTSLQGGRGSVVGTALGALFLGVVRNGLNLLRVPAYYQQLLVGIVILVAVLASSRKRK
ncbi:MAG: ABC transporter permease [Spirochaetaceae bacterium]